MVPFNDRHPRSRVSAVPSRPPGRARSGSTRPTINKSRGRPRVVMCALEALTDSSSEGFLFADRRDDVVSNPASPCRGGACPARRHDSAAPVRPTGNHPRIHSSSKLGVHHPKMPHPVSIQVRCARPVTLSTPLHRSSIPMTSRSPRCARPAMAAASDNSQAYPKT